MRTIVLICNLGMSTSLLMRRMTQAAKAEGYECEVKACAIQHAEKVIPQADAVLLGPQITFETERLTSAFPHARILSIDIAEYGRMDGSSVLAKVKEALGD